MTLKEMLTQFVKDSLLRDTHAILDESESLIERGVIDSLGLLHLMTFIEEHCGVKVPDDEVLPENFENIASIAKTVQRLRGDREPSSP